MSAHPRRFRSLGVTFDPSMCPFPVVWSKRDTSSALQVVFAQQRFCESRKSHKANLSLPNHSEPKGRRDRSSLSIWGQLKTNALLSGLRSKTKCFPFWLELRTSVRTFLLADLIKRFWSTCEKFTLQHVQRMPEKKSRSENCLLKWLGEFHLSRSRKHAFSEHERISVLFSRSTAPMETDWGLWACSYGFWLHGECGLDGPLRWSPAVVTASEKPNWLHVSAHFPDPCVAVAVVKDTQIDQMFENLEIHISLHLF